MISVHLNGWLIRVGQSMVVFAVAGILSLVVTGILNPTIPSFATMSHQIVDANGYYLNLLHQEKAEVAINPELNGGFSSKEEKVIVKNNIPTGYKLYLSMNNESSNGNNLYLNGDKTSPHYFRPINNPGGVELADGTWGYSLTNVTTDFHPVPLKNSIQSILLKNSTQPNPSGDEITVYYGAKASDGMVSGSYRGEVLYSVLTEAATTAEGTATIKPSIVTNLGGGDVVIVATSLATNMDLGEIRVEIGGSACTEINVLKKNPVTLSCKTMAKPAGKYNVVVRINKFNKTYTIVDGLEYKKKHENLLVGINTMQDTRIGQLCADTYTPTKNAITVTRNTVFDLNDYIPEAILTDVRDGVRYMVRKLADGKCWMVQNLDLLLNTNRVFTPVDTDLQTRNWTPERNTEVTPGENWATDGSDGTRSYEFGRIYYTGTGATQSVSTSGDQKAHAGNIYNWHAATAGSGATTAPGTVAEESICPKQWRLPTGGAMGDFHQLMNKYEITTPINQTTASDTRALGFPFHFIRAGNYYANGVWNRGQEAWYWSGSAWDNSLPTTAGAFHSRQALLNPVNNAFKGTGSSIRCLVR